MRKLLFFLLFTNSLMAIGQNPDSTKSNYFGIGFNFGYRLNNTSILLQYNIKNIVLTTEYIGSNFQGLGFGANLMYAIKINKTQWEPTLGIGYSTYSGGNKTYQRQREPVEKYSSFDISKSSYIIPMIGVRIGLYDFDSQRFRRKHAGFFFVRIGYRFSLNKPASVYSLEEPYPEKLKMIERSISDGLGVSVGFSLLWGNKFKKKS